MTETTHRIEEAPQPRPFRRYPECRESGIKWLGEIPAHWDIAPVYARYKVALGKMLDAKRVTGESSGRYLRNVHVQWDAVVVEDLPEMDFPPSERNRYRLQPGDLLVCEGGEVGRTAMWNGELDECFYQKAIHRVRPRSDSEIPRFFYYLMYALAKRGVFAAGGNPNTIDHLTAVQLRHHRVPFPATREQQAVATFLDRETAKIDALVANKERLIELLQEKRTALITRAVTRGLDPNVPTKDSGVEWLGEVPAHWEVRPLKSMSDLQTGLTLGKRYEGEAVTTRPYLRVANVQDGYLALDDISEVEVSVRDAARFELRMRDVLVTEGGDFDKLGRGHMWEEQIAQCLHQNHIFAVRPRRTALTPHFLALVTSSGYGRAYFTATSKQSTNLASTNATKLRNLPVALPGLAEQVEIVHWASHESARIDGLVAKIEKATDHFKELRTALISAAVTGKIDVREAAPR